MAKKAINFHRVPDWLTEAKTYKGKKLSKSVKEVYIAIWRICEGGRRKCRIAASTIMKKAAVCRSTVFSAIKLLENVGLIVVIRGGKQRELDLFSVEDCLEYETKTKKSASTKNKHVLDKSLKENSNSISSTTDVEKKKDKIVEKKVEPQNTQCFGFLLRDSSLDVDVTYEVRKYFFTIFNTVKKNKNKKFKIASNEISADTVENVLGRISTYQLKQLIYKVMNERKRGIKINYKFSYYLTCFLSYGLEKDNKIADKVNGNKFKTGSCGSFGKFQQNAVDYSAIIAQKFLN